MNLKIKYEKLTIKVTLTLDLNLDLSNSKCKFKNKIWKIDHQGNSYFRSKCKSKCTCQFYMKYDELVKVIIILVLILELYKSDYK